MLSKLTLVVSGDMISRFFFSFLCLWDGSSRNMREKENGMKNFTKHYVQNEYVGRDGDGYSFGYNKNDGYKNWI